MSQPTKFQFGAAKQMLRYVTGTSDFGIQYGSKVECVLEVFCDSDWSGDIQDMKSTSGFVFNLGSIAVCWASKKQEIVALSITEAEYVSLNAACHHSVWMKKILVDCQVKSEELFKIRCDNRSSIAIAKNPTLHGRTKHMDVKFHYTRELIARKEMNVEFCSINAQIVDIFTKCLSVQKHMKFKEGLGEYVSFNHGGILLILIEAE